MFAMRDVEKFRDYDESLFGGMLCALGQWWCWVQDVVARPTKRRLQQAPCLEEFKAGGRSVDGCAGLYRIATCQFCLFSEREKR